MVELRSTRQVDLPPQSISKKERNSHEAYTMDDRVCVCGTAPAEVQTDVLEWEGGGWKSVLTHETNVKDWLRTVKDSSK